MRPQSSPPLRAARALVSEVFERTWGAGATVAGHVRRRPVTSWSTSGRERVLVVAPHPDDEIIGCGGSIVRHARAGDHVRVCAVTDGSRSRALGLDRRAMRDRREREGAAAAARVGAEWSPLRLPEGDWEDREGDVGLARALEDLRPTVVYGPSTLDYHPDHLRVARSLARALGAMTREPALRVYASQVPLTPLVTNLVHEVGDLEVDLREALRCHGSQGDIEERALRLRRYAARFYGRSTLAETFVALPPPRYAQLVARPSAARFRAMRPGAWFDPAAALLGTSERFAWRRSLRVLALAPATAYALWAATYDEQPDNVVMALEAQLVESLLAHAPLAGRVVADVGCGTGRHVDRWLAAGPSDLVGVDVSPEMLSRLRRKHPGVRAATRIGPSLPLEDRSVDVVVSTLMLGHAHDVRTELAEWARVLRPDGAVLLTDVHPGAFGAGMRRTFSHAGKTLEVEHHAHALAELEAALGALGLRVAWREERAVDASVQALFERGGHAEAYARMQGVPLVFGLVARRAP